MIVSSTHTQKSKKKKNLTKARNLMPVTSPFKSDVFCHFRQKVPTLLCHCLINVHMTSIYRQIAVFAGTQKYLPCDYM